LAQCTISSFFDPFLSQGPPASCRHATDDNYLVGIRKFMSRRRSGGTSVPPSDASAFNWIGHTFDHSDLDGQTYNVALGEFNNNVSVANRFGFRPGGGGRLG
jgi:hypothetical protein